MNRTLKEATVRRYYYDTHDQLRGHLDDFLSAYNFARRLKTLRGLTPYEAICKAWTTEPQRFKLGPIHQMPGLNTCSVPAFRGDGPSRGKGLYYFNGQIKSEIESPTTCPSPQSAV
jgi:hypothetical protein